MKITDDGFSASRIRSNTQGRHSRLSSSLEGGLVSATYVLEGSEQSSNSKRLRGLSKNMPNIDSEESLRIKNILSLRKELVVQKNDVIFNKTVSRANQEPKKVGQLFWEMLQQPRNLRNKHTLEFLMKHMKEHPFFKTRNMKDQDILSVLECMDFSEIPEDRVVFENGSIGDQYYMIVEGVVEIQIVNKDESKLYAQTVSELLFKKDELQDLKNLIKIYESQIKEAQLVLATQIEANARNKGGYEVGTSLMVKDVVNAQKRLDETLVKFNQVTWEINQKERFKNEELMIPVLHLGSGKDFGELALKVDPSNPTKIVPRAATVKCMSNCKFATMSKKDYQKILEKIDQKNNEKLVNFFKNVPFMQPMTKTQIQKSIVGFQKRNCIRGQVICKEGTPATHVYIVYEGEFELTKTAKLDLVSYFGKADDGVSENLILKRKSGEKPKGPQNLKFATKSNVGNTNQVRFGLICSGQVCGDDDIVADRNYKATLTCTVNPSSLYVIPKSEFLRIFKSNEQVWKNLQKIKKSKAEQNALCMKNYFSINLEYKDRKVGKDDTSLKSNILLDQQETDYRYTLADIVKDYRFIKNNTHLSSISAEKSRHCESSFKSDECKAKMGLKNQYASSKYEDVYQQMIVEGDHNYHLRNKFGLVKAQSSNQIFEPVNLQKDSPENIIGNFAGWSRQIHSRTTSIKPTRDSPTRDSRETQPRESQRSIIYKEQDLKNKIRIVGKDSPSRGRTSLASRRLEPLTQKRNTMDASVDQYSVKDKIVKVAYSLKANSTMNTGFRD